MSNLNQKVKGFIVNYIKTMYIYDSEIDIPIDQPLLENGIIDSFAFIDLIAEIEREFEVRVPDEDVLPKNFGSIEKMALYVVSKLNGDVL